tara:strand:- start:336 stop:548 length:213 start_codon:yes stop_codon:yes gene_type:complete
MEVIVDYKGSILNLEGDLTQAYAGGYEEESQIISYETHEVYAGGVEITNLLNEMQLTELDELAIEYVSNL